MQIVGAWGVADVTAVEGVSEATSQTGLLNITQVVGLDTSCAQPIAEMKMYVVIASGFIAVRGYELSVGIGVGTKPTSRPGTPVQHG